MVNNQPELLILLSLEDGDSQELADLTRELMTEIEDLNVESVNNISRGSAPVGTKSGDLVNLGQMMVTLGPVVVPPLFALLKSWIERKPTTPVKVRIKVRGKTAQVEYDPTKTTAKDLEKIIKTLENSIKK